MQLAAQISGAMEQAGPPASRARQQHTDQQQQAQDQQGQEHLTDPVEASGPTLELQLEHEGDGENREGGTRPRASMCDQPARQAAALAPPCLAA